MAGLLSRLMPREGTFFNLFNEQAANLHDGARALVRMIEQYDNPQAHADAIKDIEHKGDDITHNLMTRLNQTFITPFDREDIHELASKIDDVLDLIDATASRMVIYNVDRIRPGTAELAHILEQSAGQVVRAVAKLDRHDSIMDDCIEINRLENEADRVSRLLIGKLFDNEKDPVQILKWKEILELIETATDKCEDVANVLESVALKSA